MISFTKYVTPDKSFFGKSVGQWFTGWHILHLVKAPFLAGFHILCCSCWFREYVCWQSVCQFLENDLLYTCSGRWGDLNLTNLLLFGCLSFWDFDVGVACFCWYIAFISKLVIFSITLRLILVQFLKCIIWPFSLWISILVTVMGLEPTTT